MRAIILFLIAKINSIAVTMFTQNNSIHDCKVNSVTRVQYACIGNVKCSLKKNVTELFISPTQFYLAFNFDWPVGLVVRDPDPEARGRGFDSHPGQIFV